MNETMNNISFPVHFRNSYAWQQYRGEYKQIHPLCEDPFMTHRFDRQKVAADDVHHIRPISQHPFLALCMDNLASLCRSCHSRVEKMINEGQDTEKYFPKRRIA